MDKNEQKLSNLVRDMYLSATLTRKSEELPLIILSSIMVMIVTPGLYFIGEFVYLTIEYTGWNSVSTSFALIAAMTYFMLNIWVVAQWYIHYDKYNSAKVG